MSFPGSLENTALRSGLGGRPSAQPSVPIPPLGPSFGTCPVCLGGRDGQTDLDREESSSDKSQQCCLLLCPHVCSHFVLTGPSLAHSTLLSYPLPFFLTLSTASGSILALKNKKDNTLGLTSTKDPSPSLGQLPLSASCSNPCPGPF